MTRKGRRNETVQRKVGLGSTGRGRPVLEPVLCTFLKPFSAGLGVQRAGQRAGQPSCTPSLPFPLHPLLPSLPRLCSEVGWAFGLWGRGCRCHSHLARLRARQQPVRNPRKPDPQRGVCGEVTGLTPHSCGSQGTMDILIPWMSLVIPILGILAEVMIH